MVNWQRFEGILNTDATRLRDLKRLEDNYKECKNRSNFLRDFQLETQNISIGNEAFSPMHDPEETAIRIDMEQALSKGKLDYGRQGELDVSNPSHLGQRVLEMWERDKKDSIKLHAVRNLFVALSTATCQIQMKFFIAKFFGDKSNDRLYQDICQLLLGVINSHPGNENLFFLAHAFKKMKGYMRDIETAEQVLEKLRRRE